jgi:hypothetical protein
MKGSLLLLALSLSLIVGLKSTSYAAAVRETNVNEAGEGNALLGIEGTFSSATKEQVLNLINQYRYEACKNGYRNPSNPDKTLTLDDYIPIKWSSDLEWIAQIRAAEATVNESHTRPNGKSCFTISSNGVRSTGESLAWGGSMLSGIKNWYSEKSIWVNNENGVTGHYTAMIDPSNRYIGLGSFTQTNGYWTATAGEFSRVTDLNETKSNLSGTYIQLMEVQKSAVSTPVIFGTKTLNPGGSSQLSVTSDITYDGIWGEDNISSGILRGTIQWSSSNPAVATVSGGGLVKAIQAGTSTIRAITDDGVTVSCTVTVNYPAKGTTVQSGKLSYKVTKAGSTVEFSKYTGSSKTVIIPSTVKVNGVTYKVTSIAANALKNNKKITKVVIGSNVEKIGKSAFQGCKKLKTVHVKTKKLKKGSVKAKVFKDIYAKAKIRVPSSKLKSYKTILAKSGISSKVKITK